LQVVQAVHAEAFVVVLNLPAGQAVQVRLAVAVPVVATY
jgi:hypothetical protein